jgi:hypothetical protein
MQYLLLIYRNEAQQSKMDAADYQKLLAEYSAYTQSIVQSGNFKAGDGLQPTSTATTVRVRDGKYSTTDGPFAENPRATRRLLSRRGEETSNAAIAMAARIPGAGIGSIEVRPVMIYK